MLIENLEASDAYNNFRTTTRNTRKEYRKVKVDGQHGATAKFWMIHIHLVEAFLRFNRTTRTNDVDLFIHHSLQ